VKRDLGEEGYYWEHTKVQRATDFVVSRDVGIPCMCS
jgi:hypothetical protein